MPELAPVIIIKKVKKGGHPHHGGAWKVAYADFVTAMMAFFLLLWLLNATTDDQKKGISDYFAPASVSQSSSGAGGMLGGRAISRPGAMTSGSAVSNIEVPLTPGEGDGTSDGEGDGKGDNIGHARVSTQGKEAGGPADGKKTGGVSDGEKIGGVADGEKIGGAADGEKSGGAADGEETGGMDDEDKIGLTDREFEIEAAKREEDSFIEAEQYLREAVEASPELREFIDNLVIDRTPEGLRIQIVDNEGQPMFASGQSRMFPRTKALLEQVAVAMQSMTNKISITGHTDSVPYKGKKAGFGNWELSSGRALSARRVLMQAGMEMSRITKVIGRAADDPLLPDDPEHARNRRISLVVLRQNPPPGYRPIPEAPPEPPPPVQKPAPVKKPEPKPVPKVEKPKPSAVFERDFSFPRLR